MPDESTDEELTDLASQELLTRLQSAVRTTDTTNYVDVEPEEVMKASDAPDFAFINTYRIDVASGRQMRVKVTFADVDDIALGLAYQGAVRGTKTTKETRERLERKLWKACVAGPESIHSDRWYKKAKPQCRAELTTHCLVRLGLENARLSGLGQDAFVPAGTLAQTLPPVEPETPATPVSPGSLAPSAPPSAEAKPTPSSTASSTSSKSPGGTASVPSRSSAGGPPLNSRRRGSQVTARESRTG